ncbi:MAG: hypothetical protein LBM19_03085 [Holosporales bacterium]|jgi:hypothetical protein|nr:hypothetical protein [Holosporales bacterium]
MKKILTAVVLVCLAAGAASASRWAPRSGANDPRVQRMKQAGQVNTRVEHRRKISDEELEAMNRPDVVKRQETEFFGFSS